MGEKAGGDLFDELAEVGKKRVGTGGALERLVNFWRRDGTTNKFHEAFWDE